MPEGVEGTDKSFSVSEIKRDLLDPRAISKKHDSGGRGALARNIAQTRTHSQLIEGKKAENEQLVSDAGDLAEQIYEKTGEVNDRKRSPLVRLKGLLRIGDAKLAAIQSELTAKSNEYSYTSARAFQTRQETNTLKQEQEGLPDPKALLEAYYEKMKTQPLTQEEKREYLKPELLESLTTEEYIALWQRLNPYFLSHVTRQGFRDHNAMVYHSGGLQEYHNGFVSILNDVKKLRPPLAMRGLPNRDEASVRGYLQGYVLDAANADEARERFDTQLHFTLASAPKYSDETAVHFMTQTVGDNYYGGESGNEVFFIFPTDVLASQHDFAFNGWEKDFTKPQSEQKWNDVFVWPHDLNDPNIPIDAGMVFLPGKTPVDPETGSKYTSEVKIVDGKEVRVMVEDPHLIQVFTDWALQLTDRSPVKQAFDAFKGPQSRYSRSDTEFRVRQFYEACKTEFEKLGFSPDAISSLSSEILGNWTLDLSQHNDSQKVEFWQDVIKKSGAHYVRAYNAVSARDYWEGYFTQNPDQRPAHVQYYDADPTTAIYEFQQKNGIGQADTSEAEGQLLGFNDHHVANPNEDPRAKRGYDELVEMGNKIIDEKYQTIQIPEPV